MYVGLDEGAELPFIFMTFNYVDGELSSPVYYIYCVYKSGKLKTPHCMVHFMAGFCPVEFLKLGPSGP